MIYFDNAATTRMDEEVFLDMCAYLKEEYGNSQSQHAAGRRAAEGLISARDGVAEIFGCSGEEVYFVSGGTEAGNLAVQGVCGAHGMGHIIISAIEHPAVYESALRMQKMGFGLTIIPPDGGGFIRPEEVERAIRPDTVLCAVMAVNNELGTVQDVRRIGEICTRHGIFYYCDFVQAVGHMPFPVGYCSAFSVSAHKFYGPKGVAAMYIKKGSKIEPLICGGRQERGLRGGTVNVASAVGLYSALKRAKDGNWAQHMAQIKANFLNGVLAETGGVTVNGGNPSVPSILNLSFEGCEGANIVFCLDLEGICASTGSACSAGAVTPSRVVTAVCGEERAKSAVRFSFGKHNTLEEAGKAALALKKIISRIRK